VVDWLGRRRRVKMLEQGRKGENRAVARPEPETLALRRPTSFNEPILQVLCLETKWVVFNSKINNNFQLFKVSLYARITSMIGLCHFLCVCIVMIENELDIERVD